MVNATKWHEKAKAAAEAVDAGVYVCGWLAGGRGGGKGVQGGGVGGWGGDDSKQRSRWCPAFSALAKKAKAAAEAVDAGGSGEAGGAHRPCSRSCSFGFLLAAEVHAQQQQQLQEQKRKKYSRF
jgi:hypothetical protein